MKWGRWLWLLLLVPLVGGVIRLRFDAEVLHLLPEGLPVVEGLKLYQQHFSNGQELIVTVDSPDAETAESAARQLAEAYAQLTPLVRSAVWQPPWLDQPTHSAEFLAMLWLNQPPAHVEKLCQRLAATNLPSILSRTRDTLTTSMSIGDIARLSYDPFGLSQFSENQPSRTSSSESASVTQNFFPSTAGQEQKLFASRDGRFRLIYVQAQDELKTYRDADTWLAQIKSVENDLRESRQIGSDTKIGYTGRPAFLSEIATGMEGDMIRSVLGMAVIIAGLFGLAHRRILPLLWLLLLLSLILAGTLAIGGLVLGMLNVVSVGFAAILLGLAADYGMVLYQEARVSSRHSAVDIQRLLKPSIGWAATTTAGAFITLNLSGLPGLAQLGTLVAIGVLLAAVVMLRFFLPPLMRGMQIRSQEQDDTKATPITEGNITNAPRLAVTLLATGFAVMVPALILWQGQPALDHTAEALRPTNSAASVALNQIKARMEEQREPLWLLVSGTNETAVASRLNRANAVLQRAVSNHLITEFTLPLELWPRTANQQINRHRLASLADQREQFRTNALSQGFTDRSLVLTDSLLDYWSQAGQTTNVFWPTNASSRWILDRFAARTSNAWLAVGLIYTATNALDGIENKADALVDDLPSEGAWLTGWALLGEGLLSVVQRDFWRVTLPMALLVCCSLWLTFRRWSEVLLSFATLGGSALLLWAAMSVTGWSWNLLNLMALPLLLGAGVDYSIHMQMSLRRHAGNRQTVRRSTGRALLLCGGTTIAGFGSLAWSSNAGLASLGQVCALGIACTLVVSLVLLPLWWTACHGKNADNLDVTSSRDPSKLYRGDLWQLGVKLGPWLATSLGKKLCRVGALIFYVLDGSRREIVIRNLLPVFNNDRDKAAVAARELYGQMALKVADLWRFEKGLPVDNLFAELIGWESFTAARSRGRGVLLLTIHLGNWELGSPLLTGKGVPLHVLTRAEPGNDFTEQRQVSRAQWGIKTLVVGSNPFDSVAVIKCLDAGETVALLVDRPAEYDAVTVELFGRKFLASTSPAELARASGCAVMPVYIVRTSAGYVAHLMREITYDRRALRNLEQRQELVQQIMRAFEPIIRQHANQWFHFVPAWPER